MSSLPPRLLRALPLLAIAATLFFLAGAFAWTAGWIPGQRLTAQRFTDALEAGNGGIHPGFRRAHAKGVCISGRFVSSGAGATLTRAGMLAPDAVTPVLGRLSIGGGDPHAPDATTRVRSMGLLLSSANGQQWRMAMNNFPFFAVSTPEAFYEQALANRPDPATGKPDPAKLAALLQRHPEIAKFQQWAKTAPWPDSWGNTQFNGVNAFRFSDGRGKSHFVRWSMQPQLAFAPMEAARRAEAEPDYLADDLRTRLARGPLRWDLVLTVAADGDPITDPSQPWPSDRQRVVAGTLEIDAMQPQASGACRDVNFDPTVLPAGIAPSADPVLAARASVYAQSYNRREREIALGQAPDATAKERAR
ncbi:catalase family peroxidase [Thermomonas sp.]|uniref:catalase family peroxidase n=1 Tax=Thermomonas sp. TaxID=1971895 RepID=UPI003D104136